MGTSFSAIILVAVCEISQIWYEVPLTSVQFQPLARIDKAPFDLGPFF
jgi:hypothetical protein